MTNPLLMLCTEPEVILPVSDCTGKHSDITCKLQSFLCSLAAATSRLKFPTIVMFFSSDVRKLIREVIYIYLFNFVCSQTRMGFL